jgi:hypothetical protein
MQVEQDLLRQRVQALGSTLAAREAEVSKGGGGAMVHLCPSGILKVLDWLPRTTGPVLSKC